jgi:hypothetical protein
MSSYTTTQTVASTTLSAQQPVASSHLPLPSEHKLPKAKKVPTFDDPLEKRKWEKGQMAAAFRVFADLGFSDGVAGHMSLRGKEYTNNQKRHC